MAASSAYFFLGFFLGGGLVEEGNRVWQDCGISLWVFFFFWVCFLDTPTHKAENVWVSIWEVGVHEPRRCDGGGRRRWWWWRRWWWCCYSLHRTEKCVVILGSVYLISRAWSAVTAGGDSEHLHHKETLWRSKHLFLLVLVHLHVRVQRCSWELWTYDCSLISTLWFHTKRPSDWSFWMIISIKGWDGSKLKIQWWSTHPNAEGKSINSTFLSLHSKTTSQHSPNQLN